MTKCYILDLMRLYSSISLESNHQHEMIHPALGCSPLHVDDLTFLIHHNPVNHLLEDFLLIDQIHSTKYPTLFCNNVQCREWGT